MPVAVSRKQHRINNYMQYLNMRNILVRHRKLYLEHSEETVHLIYYMQSYMAAFNQNINYFPSNKTAQIATGITNKQQEVRKALQKLHQPTNESLVYESEDFVKCEDELLRTILAHDNDQVDEEADFGLADNYLTTDDLIIKSSHKSPDLHLWTIKKDK